MEKTFEVTESFIREAHKAACRDWKKKLEAKFPIFAPKSMWYTQKGLPNWLCHLNSDGSGYGFDMKGDWKDSFKDMNDYIKNNCNPATAEQVESALKGEAIKRGLVPGIYINSTWCGGKSFNKTPEKYTFSFTTGLKMEKESLSLTIFNDGIWAEPYVEKTNKPVAPIPTPEEITRVLDYLKSKQ